MKFTNAKIWMSLLPARPSLAAGRTLFNFSGATITDIPAGNMPNLLNSSHTITADIDVPQAGGGGMIVNEGGRFWGYGLYLMKGSPVFTYNLLGLKRTKPLDVAFIERCDFAGIGVVIAAQQ